MMTERITSWAWIWIILACITVLSVFVIFRVPGYNRAGVLPELLSLQTPMTLVKAHNYFDGGSIGVEITDAAGRSMLLALPCQKAGGPPPDGAKRNYSRLFVGSLHISKPGGVLVECSEDSKRFIAELIDRHGQPGWDRNFVLFYLRHQPVDRWRVWWERNNTYE